MKIYHGSAVEVPKPLLSKGKPNKTVGGETDYGEGRIWTKIVCGMCRGEGLTQDEYRRGIGGRIMRKKGGTCSKCKGKGYEEHMETCDGCRGRRYVQADEIIETGEEEDKSGSGED